MHIPNEIIFMILSYLQRHDQFHCYLAFFGRKFAKREIQRKGVTLYLGKKLNEEVTDILVHHRIKIIDMSAFRYSNIKSVILQEGLETIRSSAFYFTKKCKYINFPSTLKEIQYDAFSGCGLDIIDLSSTNLKKIEWSCFSYNYAKKIILPKRIEDICYGAFSGNFIEEIFFPDTLKSLGKTSFEGCPMLKRIDLSNTKLTELKEEVFRNCVSLEEIIFPENLLEIHDKCFMNTAVVNLKLPDSLTFLGNHVFSNCIELKTVKLGETLNVIEMSCFANCTNLKIVYSESCKKLDYIGYGAFTNCKSLEKIYFPQSLKKIDSNAFKNTHALSEAILPKSLDTLGSSAFSWSGITKVFIPKTLKQLTYGVFRNTNLKEVFIPKEIEYVSQDAFKDCFKLKIFRV